MKKPIKTRPRGGASVPCPKCGASSKVLETRRQDASTSRWRVCSNKKPHKFETEEKAK